MWDQFAVYESGMCRWNMRRRVRARRESMLGQRHAELRHERPVGSALAMRGIGMRFGRVYRRLRSGDETVQQLDASNLRLDR